MNSRRHMARMRPAGRAEEQLRALEEQAASLSPMSPVAWKRLRRAMLELEGPLVAEFAAEVEVVLADRALVDLERRLCEVSGLDVLVLGGGRLTEEQLGFDVDMARIGPLE